MSIDSQGSLPGTRADFYPGLWCAIVDEREDKFAN